MMVACYREDVDLGLHKAWRAALTALYSCEDSSGLRSGERRTGYPESMELHATEEIVKHEAESREAKIVVVMPAYNAAKTLKITYDAIPHQAVDQIILVDDGSTDRTLEIARELQLTVFVHTRNFGYGANQKTCYTEALKEGADIVVMLHPDYQYDPTLLPEILAPIKSGEADIVLGSRFLSGSTMQQGMPWWKFIGNKFLTALENWTLGLNLSEYHTGYRAYTRRVLEQINFSMNSDKFVFDQELLVQASNFDFVIKEVPVPNIFPRLRMRALWTASSTV